ncbi:hypothetical protein PUN28_015470 [Cardiocondyla obscurior]|uniref:Uncharacterized protein n=1 Tax=Cardiocondyla obscurior TaxID=286306 RepID=A0AAW2EUG4_9HYME
MTNSMFWVFRTNVFSFMSLSLEITLLVSCNDSDLKKVLALKVFAEDNDELAQEVTVRRTPWQSQRPRRGRASRRTRSSRSLLPATRRSPWTAWPSSTSARCYARNRISSRSSPTLLGVYLRRSPLPPFIRLSFFLRHSPVQFLSLSLFPYRVSRCRFFVETNTATGRHRYYQRLDVTTRINLLQGKSLTRAVIIKTKLHNESIQRFHSRERRSKVLEITIFHGDAAKYSYLRTVHCLDFNYYLFLINKEQK